MADPLESKGSNDALVGALFVLASGVGFGSVTVLARIAFEGGSNAPTSLALRFGMGAAIFWLLLLARRQVRQLPARRIAAFALMGLLFAAGSTVSFMSVERIPASLSALVFYIYPAIVTAGSALFFGTRFSLPQLGVLVAAVTGCALTVDLQAGGIDALGLALALATPFFYSGYVLLGSRATLGIAPLNASAWIMTFAAPLMVLLGITGAFGDRLTADISARGWAAIAGLTIFSTVISISTFLAGMARLDPFRAAILSTIEPVVSVVLAALLLSERLTAQQILGGIVIVSSTIALQVVQRRRDVGRRSVHVPRPVAAHPLRPRQGAVNGHARMARLEVSTMSSSDRNIRKPASDGLNKDELAAEKADENPVAEFSLFGGDLAEAAAEAAAANQLAPEEASRPAEDDEDDKRRQN